MMSKRKTSSQKRKNTSHDGSTYIQGKWGVHGDGRVVDNINEQVECHWYQQILRGPRYVILWMGYLFFYVEKLLKYMFYPFDVFFSGLLKMEICGYRFVFGKSPLFLEELFQYLITKKTDTQQDKTSVEETKLKKVNEKLELGNVNISIQAKHLLKKKETSVRELNQTNQAIKKELDKAKSEIKKYENDKIALKKEYEDTLSILQYDHNKLVEKKKQEMEDYIARLQYDFKCEIERLKTEKNSIEDEKQDALRRLSELASVRLRHNNPNIVDLNDQCRPTKLAEMFSELYDNQWTSAFDVLEKRLSEKQTIAVLLDSVMMAYDFCKKKIQRSWEDLSYWFLNEELQGCEETTKWLKDSRKHNVQLRVHDVEKDFAEKILAICDNTALRESTKNEDVVKYFHECVKLCLLMVATDPPVVMACPGWITYTFDDHERETCTRNERESVSESGDPFQQKKNDAVEKDGERADIDDNLNALKENNIKDKATGVQNAIEVVGEDDTNDQVEDDTVDKQGMGYKGDDEGKDKEEVITSNEESGVKYDKIEVGEEKDDTVELETGAEGENRGGEGIQKVPVIRHDKLNDNEKIKEEVAKDGALSDEEETRTKNKMEINENNIKVGQASHESKPILSKQRKPYQKDFYKEYTKRGPYLDFVVWPALYLHADGQLLSKGVAQGAKSHADMDDEEWTWMKHK